MSFKPAPINGLGASTVQLNGGPWATWLAALCAEFPKISEAQWQSRFERGRVFSDQGEALQANAAFKPGSTLHYYREVPQETVVPFEEAIVHQDEHLLVADKPHFLPVTPSGGYVEQTLLARVVRRTGLSDLVPLHRIDRGTAGLVLFSTNPASRGRYQALFRDRSIRKTYEALAAPLPLLSWPLVHRSRLVDGEPFFRMQEGEGTPNTETRIDVLERGGTHWRYALSPVTGKKHQLRVHMAALGAPIEGDDFYPEVLKRPADDYSQPLKLLARGLSFVDPVSGELRRFASRLSL